MKSSGSQFYTWKEIGITEFKNSGLLTTWRAFIRIIKTIPMALTKILGDDSDGPQSWLVIARVIEYKIDAMFLRWQLKLKNTGLLTTWRAFIRIIKTIIHTITNPTRFNTSTIGTCKLFFVASCKIRLSSHISITS